MNNNINNIQNQMNNMNLNNLANNQMNQINIQNNYVNQLFQANLMSNYQAEMVRMNYYSNLNLLNSDLNAPGVYAPMTENGQVEVLEKYLSLKNLNKDINLRENMNEENGNVPIEFILNLEKIKSMQLTQERICELIDKEGSDKIEHISDGNNTYLRPKNFEEIKNKLKSIEEIKQNQKQKNMNVNQTQQPNMQYGYPPMYFYPQPMMFYNPMMMQNQQGMINQNQGNNEENNDNK